jgi:hypothetical protein
MTIKVLSYGGGLDSYGMLLDAIDRGELPDVVAFCDVSNGSLEADPTDPGEWPGTYRHIREVAAPLCASLGIRFEYIDTVRYPIRRAGNWRSLFAYYQAKSQIPVCSKRFRNCTAMAKVERFERWLDDTFPGQTVEVWIGFEAGEEDRADSDPNAGKTRKPRADRAVRINRFPLIERGLCRCRIEKMVRDKGLAVPRKSACTFCPFGKRCDWRSLRDQLPETWAEVVKLEADKPLTSNGVKMGLKGQGRLRRDGSRAPTKLLPEWVEMVDKEAQSESCGHCGASVKATKRTGVDYLAPALKAAPRAAHRVQLELAL